ncbi:GAF domain-containing protein [Mycoplasma sp. Pen4]|uniref:GAF domain-containing protein n=1 Tax=Mycoplasma sp. Pen4 TaxID=640330 RepID=UPI0016540F8B|nr:GAF domain-containing protein [Mycoplasma sp. Pen4]QNM93347.1 GAF domain-containing protein [Mycoplasma sp. Pen4]
MKKQEYISLLDAENRVNALLSNTTAYINDTVDNLNWVGFYLAEGETLYLHTFQGKIACSMIPFSRGVCGYAATTRKTVVVDDVHTFSDHIACDANSKSEIVLPIIINDQVFGVLDIDAPVLSRFDEQLTNDLKELVEWLENKLASLLNK